MDVAGRVTVFAFEVFDLETRDYRLSRYKASRELIGKWGGRLLEGTGEKVDPGELDRHGRFRRVATGWGELPKEASKNSLNT
jgi:hypothetical protein